MPFTSREVESRLPMGTLQAQKHCASDSRNFRTPITIATQVTPLNSANKIFLSIRRSLTQKTKEVKRLFCKPENSNEY